MKTLCVKDHVSSESIHAKYPEQTLETECGSVVGRGQDEGERGETVRGLWVCLGGDEEVLEVERGSGCTK